MNSDNTVNSSMKLKIPPHMAELLGTPEEVVKKIEKAESEGSLFLALNYAGDATFYGLIDLSSKVDELRERIRNKQKEILEKAPLGETLLREDGFFASVCCSKLRAAILDGDVWYIPDCMTGEPSLTLGTEELVKMAFGDNVDEDYGETGECPFCGKKFYGE